jgi:GAF domain-containing protein
VPDTRHEHNETSVDQVIRRLDEVTDALDALSDTLAQEENLAAVLQRLCQQVIKAIPGADMASVTLVRNNHPVTAAATDGPTQEVDEAQYRSGQGPCLEAATTGRTIRADLTEVQSRWPQFAQLVHHTGVDSYLSAPLFIDSQYHGSLNLYSRQAHGYHQLDATILQLYTTAAEAALRAEQRYLQARHNAEQLRTALTSRAIIDQAKGIVMGAHAVTADEAFNLLVEQSQHENVKLRDIAERLITRIVQPKP